MYFIQDLSFGNVTYSVHVAEIKYSLQIIKYRCYRAGRLLCSTVYTALFKAFSAELWISSLIKRVGAKTSSKH